MTRSEPSWPDLAGRLNGGRHILPVRIYFEDTDFSGVVYHGAYVRFLERGRSDFLRLAGVGHDELARGDHGEPLAFTVRRMSIEFVKPARIDDVIEITTEVTVLSAARLGLRQTVIRAETILVTADVEVAIITANGVPRRLPASVRDKLPSPAVG